MKKKILITTIILHLFVPLFSLARDLEVDYPDIPGKQSQMENIFQYTQYIFNFSVWIIGIVAFSVLVLAGVRYITSIGNPSVLKDTKNQILSALLGIMILLLSVIILTQINPSLLKLEEEKLEPPGDDTVEFNIEDENPDPLSRIKKLAEDTKNDILPPLIIKHKDLLKLVKKCDCIFASSMCDCIGWSCNAIKCYGDPCVDINNEINNRDEINKKQYDIVLFSSGLISYYKNRIDTEREDIRAELDHFIFWEILSEEQSNNLEKYLEEIVPLMEELVKVSLENSELPDECLLPEKCSPHCRGKCHNACENAIPCKAKVCTGGNPCPIEKMEKKMAEMEETKGKIIALCNKIIAILS
jgi:hypothetical protein